MTHPRKQTLTILEDEQVTALCQRIVNEFPNQPSVRLHAQEIERALRERAASPALPGPDKELELAIADVYLATTFPWFQDAVKQRAADNYDLSQRYANGEGVPKNDAESGRWLMVAAFGGHPQAQLEMGQHYLETRDFRQAEEWFQQAADQGLADAQYNLACLLHDRNDEVGAERWWRQAAGQNHALAQTSMGRKYHFGYGTPRDYNEAIRWYVQGGNQGVADAWVNLGLIYDECNQVQEAIKWWLLAANHGHILGQCNLGNTYYHKIGNFQEAARWWHLAALQGDAEAQYCLGSLYFNSGNRAEGIYWLRLAAQQGHPKALTALQGSR